jgi:CMP-N-acetylneuraminic acid synthetase
MINKEGNKIYIVFHNREFNLNIDLNNVFVYNINMLETNMNFLAKKIIEKYSIEGDLIYIDLTENSRDYLDIESIYNFYKKNNFESLLCSIETKAHPYLMIYDLGAGRGKSVIEQENSVLERPKVYSISYYVCIFNSQIIDKLNINLYNDNTYFYLIEELDDYSKELGYKYYC